MEAENLALDLVADEDIMQGISVSILGDALLQQLKLFVMSLQPWRRTQSRPCSRYLPSPGMQAASTSRCHGASGGVGSMSKAV